LGKIGDSSAVPALTVHLNDEDTKVVEAVVGAVAEIGDGDILPLIIPYWLKDEDETTRAGAAILQTILGDANPLPELVKTLESENILARILAIMALGKLEYREVLPLLVRATKDDKSAVRWAAVRALRNIGDTGAVTALVEALNDDDSRVRRTAAQALGKFGAENAVPALAKTLTGIKKSKSSFGSSSDDDLRAAVRRALRQIGTPEALAALKNARRK